MTIPVDDVRNRLLSLRPTAEAELLAASADATLCAIGRSGSPQPAVKYHEGRTAALSMLDRALPESGDASDALADTASHFDRFIALATGSPDWRAYREGAMDALSAASGR